MSEAPTVHREKSIRLTEIVGADSVIRSQRFEKCTLRGPAIVILLDSTTIAGCSWDAPGPDGLFWPIDDEREVIVGAVGLADCQFIQCRFTNVGIAAKRQDLPALRAGFDAG